MLYPKNPLTPTKHVNKNMNKSIDSTSPSPVPKDLDPIMAQVWKYWQDKKNEAEGEFPTLKQIMLMDLHKVASNLLIIDVIDRKDEPSHFRWRYWGTSLTDYFGAELCGKFVHEQCTEEASAYLTRTYDWVVDNRTTHYWTRQGGLINVNYDHLTYHRLICPIEGASGEVAHLFGAVTFPKNVHHEAIKQPVIGSKIFSVSEPD